MKRVVQSLFDVQILRLKSRKTAEVEAEIQSLASKIPPQVLSRAERFWSRGRKAVASVSNGVCCECHIRLARGAFNSLLLGADLQTCGNCGRYLYLSQEERSIFDKQGHPEEIQAKAE